MADRDRLTDTLARVMGTADDPLRLARDRIAALEAECARLRRERDEARRAARQLVEWGDALVVAGTRTAKEAFVGLVEAVRGLYAWVR